MLHAFVVSRRVQKLWARITRREFAETQNERQPTAPGSDSDINSDFARHVIEQHGGYTIFCFQVLRALACLTLLLLSVYTAMQDEGSIVGILGKKGKHGKKHKHRHPKPPLSDKEWIDLLITMTFVSRVPQIHRNGHR